MPHDTAIGFQEIPQSFFKKRMKISVVIFNSAKLKKIGAPNEFFILNTMY